MPARRHSRFGGDPRWAALIDVRGKQVRLEALSARTGKMLWSVRHDAEDPDDPTVANGMLYIGLTTGVDAYSLP
jgi:outer membrane protein assembly factor BamB